MYIPSINIEYTRKEDFHYTVTPNARSVYQDIVARFASGVHSFTIVGSYGTGKSSFLYELEEELKGAEVVDKLVLNPHVFNDYDKFDFINIVGDYVSLAQLLSERLNVVSKSNGRNAINALNDYYNKVSTEGKFLFIYIDEFGKVLEHAVNNDVETESFFLQQLAEYVNAPQRNIILLTTLHQNFSAYASKLTQAQRDEWSKVKGRFCDIVFHEPIEQLLFLAAKDMQNVGKVKSPRKFHYIYQLAKDSKTITDITEQDIQKLYPLEPFSAMATATAIQRYGQNERSLFSFLQSDGTGSLKDFAKRGKHLFTLADVCDYVQYNFFSALSQVNPDTPKWNALQIAIERTQNGTVPDDLISEALLVIKVIGMVNILSPESVTLTDKALKEYSKDALGIKNAQEIISKLKALKIIRYAAYRSRYVLFDGTDVDLEGELYKLGTLIPKREVSKELLEPYFYEKYQLASSYYYRTGTPRYFKYILSDEVLAQDEKFDDDTDGLICLFFPTSLDTIDKVLASSKTDTRAIIYVAVNKTEELGKHLWEIEKLQHLWQEVDKNDKVAIKEVNNQLEFEKEQVDKAINDSLFNDRDVVWVYKGVKRDINSFRQLNQLVSDVFTEVYCNTPIVKCEMLNKDKISASISTARRKLLLLMLENSTEEDLGFDKDKFPPEKTIYNILLKETGMHKKGADGEYGFGKPDTKDVKPLWDVCMDFLNESQEKGKNLTELVDTLRKAPFRIKQGLLNTWIPIFLIVEQSGYALYQDGRYVPTITEEVLDIMLKSFKGFKVKAFSQTPIDKELFDQYRIFLKKPLVDGIRKKKFNNTYSQFFMFYKQLSPYTRNTRKFENIETLRFRDVLANAIDPEKALFTDIPQALGFSAQARDGNSDSYDGFISRLKSAVHELVVCYDGLIGRIETSVVTALGLSSSYDEYKGQLEKRYSHVKDYLLSSKTRAFYRRVMSPIESKRKFYESIGNVVLDKPLEEIKDEEEELLIDNTLYYFRELDRSVEVSKYNETDNDVYSIELTSNVGESIKNNTVILSKSKKKEVNDIEAKIAKLVDGKNEVGTAAMLQLLGKMMKDND